ncbi:MAG: IclR family transcriptional regulator [Hyphomicrobiales bacterium]|nr:IclR family transcriptional regulator [Hyphomicrobiales bacterium]MCP5373737.1 IclR family transcriptional regulator [Hyphomicrobiales bacterium]
MDDAATRDGDNRGSRSIRALEVVEAVIDADGPVTMAALADATGLPRASLHRIVGLLTDEGFLRTEPGGRGLIGGPRLLRLARRTQASAPAMGHRHGILAVVAREVGETFNIAVPAGDGMRYHDRVETEWPLRHQLPIGSQVPLHCTASGKLYLSSLPRRERDKLLSVLPLERHTPKTMTTAAELGPALDEIRRTRCGVDDEEFIDGMVALAVPITDGKGRMIAALAFHAPRVRMSLQQARAFLPVVRRAAAAMSEDPQDQDQDP